MRARRLDRSQGGHVLLVTLCIVLVCAALGATVLLPAIARQRGTEAYVRHQRALHMAETGVELAVTELRENNGAMPSNGIAKTSVDGLGTYTVMYTAGDANAIDDDGDGTVDEADEDCYVIVTSVGESGSESRAIQVVTRQTIDLPTIDAALTINVAAPVVDVHGNRFIVDGRDHTLGGVHDPMLAAAYAVATPSPAADIEAQLSPLVVDQFLGTTASPSITQSALADLGDIVTRARTEATTELQPGAHANQALGTATEGGVEVVVCDGDLHLSGNSSGAGLLVVSGDLTITGNFTWTGLIIVDGTVRMSGGGTSKMLVGALVIGQEVQSIDTDLTLSGTVDLLFSTAAVELATSQVARASVLTWREVAVP